MADASETDTYESHTYESDTYESDTYESESEADDEKIDTSWIANFKKEEESYNNYYKEPLASIMLYVLYVNSHKELMYVDTNRCLLDETGWLKRDRMIALIKQYQTRKTVNYKLHSLLRYNIDLNPDEITAYISNTDDMNRFLTSEKYLDDIHFNESIAMFQDLNALYFLFYEEKLQAPCTNQTKRITLATKHRKTMRNKYKKNLKIRKEIV
jgi:hypothetical protein